MRVDLLILLIVFMLHSACSRMSGESFSQKRQPADDIAVNFAHRVGGFHAEAPMTAEETVPDADVCMSRVLNSIGLMDERLAERIISPQMAGLCMCYRNDAGRDMFGHATLSWIVEEDGSVHAVNIEESTLNHKESEDCLVRSAQKLRFPERAGAGAVLIVSRYDWIGEK